MKYRLLAALCAVSISTAWAVAPEVRARREAVATAQAELVAARDKAKVEYAAARERCKSLGEERFRTCRWDARAERKRAMAAARAAYESAVAQARRDHKG